jgi:AraC-like DNA-binding protein
MTAHHRLQHACIMCHPRHWVMAAHSHADFNELLVVTEGGIETAIRGQRLAGRPGDVLVYPRGAAHEERATDGRPLTTLFLIWREADGTDLTSWPLLVHDASGRIQALVRWMLELSPATGPEAQRTLDALLQGLLHEFVHHPARPQDALVQRVKEFVRERLAQPIALDDLARAASMSKFHFTRVFRAAAGQSPMRFVRQLRVEAARSLLLTTDLPLRAVAPRVGFADEFQLSRVFRRVAGHPPSALRQGR